MKTEIIIEQTCKTTHFITLNRKATQTELYKIYKNVPKSECFDDVLYEIEKTDLEVESYDDVGSWECSDFEVLDDRVEED